MKHNFLLPMLFAALSTTVLAQPSLSDKIDELAAAYTKLNRFSGALLAAKGGQVILKKGYGMADDSAGIPNTPSTRIRIASMTKQFTAAAIMQLEEAGKLSVNDRLSKYIPDYPQGDRITIHNLLTHSSGIFNCTRLKEFDSVMRHPATRESIIGLFRDKPLGFEPGEKYSYSNSGYFLLGCIIEKVSGMSYAEYMRRKIFLPLGMMSSGIETGMELPAGHACGYRMDSSGLHRDDTYNMSVLGAAGAMYSTVEDLYLWDRALTSEKLLKKETLERMFTPFKGNYAYGWETLSDSAQAGRRYLKHGGWMNGYTSFINRLPDEDITVITLANRESTAATIMNYSVVKILYGDPYDVPVERKAIAVDAKILEQYVGEYKLPEFSLVIMTENGKLYGQAPQESKFEMYPESESQFFLKVIDAQIRFSKDEAGKVTELIMHRNGRDFPGPKVK